MNAERGSTEDILLPMIKMDSYITIKESSYFEYEDRKSVFIGQACPVSTEADAIAFIDSVKKKYPDAATLTRPAQQKMIAAMMRQGFSAGEVLAYVKAKK